MKFSVLLSIYHKEDPSNLSQSLDSIFNQTVLPTEIILVKDGPLTDYLDNVIAEYEEKYSILKVISLKENRGLGFALNEGLKYCSYEWVARMDTDDICFPYRFEKQLIVIENHPEVSFIGSSISEFFDSPQNVVSYRKLPENHENIYNYAKSRCPINHPTVMYKKEAVLSCGGYKDFPEDYHLWVRALLKGYKFYNIQEPLLYFRTNVDVIRRRGGFKYAFSEFRHQKEFYKMGFITFPQLFKNSIIRFMVRILPVGIRKQIYNKKLRTKIQ